LEAFLKYTKVMEALELVTLKALMRQMLIDNKNSTCQLAKPKHNLLVNQC
jgi:hypothetical protein